MKKQTRRKAKRKIKRVESSGFKYLKEQVVQTLRWIERCKWAATGLLLFISTMYWHSFIIVEKIPLSIASPSVVASLPVVFSLMAFFVIVLAIYACSPIMIFFTSTGKKNGDEQFVVPRTEVEFNKISKSLMWRWILIQASILMTLVLIEKSDSEYSLLIVLSSFVFVSWLTICLLKTIRFSAWKTLKNSWRGTFWFVCRVTYACTPKKNREYIHSVPEWIREYSLKEFPLSVEFLGMAILAVFAQMVIAFLVFVSVFNGVIESGEGRVWAWLISSVTLVLLAVIQLSVVRILKLWSSGKNFLTQLIVIFFLVILGLGICPPSGSFMLGNTLRNTSSGARHCAVVFWGRPDTPSEVKSLGSYKNHDRSRPLRILMEADGYYFVRVLEAKDGDYAERKRANGRKEMSVELIPRALIAGMDKCPLLSKQNPADQSRLAPRPPLQSPLPLPDTNLRGNARRPAARQ